MTFLDELAGLCLDAEEQASYRQDPAGWLTAHWCGRLCGEDVAAAVPVLRNRLPSFIASRLRLDDDGQRAGHAATGTPASSPAHGETELDAAVRLLGHLLLRLNQP